MSSWFFFFKWSALFCDVLGIRFLCSCATSSQGTAKFILLVGFIFVSLSPPHTQLIIICLQILEHERNKPLVQKAWQVFFILIHIIRHCFDFRNYMNDCLRTNIFVRYSVQTISSACIFLAARQLQVSFLCISYILLFILPLLSQVPLPENPPWWELLDVQYKDMKVHMIPSCVGMYHGLLSLDYQFGVISII